jgi:HEAT repeat protein
VEVLLPDLNDTDWRVRRNAAQALGALRDRRAVGPLLELLKDRVMTVRQRAVVALGRIQEPRTIPVLVDLLLNDKSGRVQSDALQAIRKFKKKAVPEVAAAYARTKDSRLLDLLVEMKYEGTLDTLLALLESGDASTRYNTIRQLGRLGDKRAVPDLIDQLHSDHGLIAPEAVRALGTLDAREAIPQLLDLLMDNDLHGSRSALYRAITEAFQFFSGIHTEIEKISQGKFPVVLDLGGATMGMPEALSSLDQGQFQALNNMLSNVEARAENISEQANVPADVVKKVVENLTWKFGVMFADARDAGQDRLKRLIELLDSESNLTRAAAALSIPWYGNEAALKPMKKSTQDPDEIVRTAAVWALDALRATLEHRKGTGTGFGNG